MITRVGIFFAACVAVLTLGVVSISPDRYNHFIEQKVISVARDAGVPLSLEGFSFGFQSLAASRMQATIQSGNLPFIVAADDMRITPHWFSLLSSQKNIDIDAVVYGGTISSRLALTPDEGRMRMQIALEDLDIAAHPQIAGFGIVRGTLSLHADTLELSQTDLPKGAINLHLKDARTAGEIILPPQTTGLPLPLRLPQLDNASLSAKLQLAGERIHIPSFSSDSSWGSIAGSGNVVLDEDDHVRAFAIEASIELSDAGKQHFGSYLPLITSNRISARQTSFDITIAGMPVRVVATPTNGPDSGVVSDGRTSANLGAGTSGQLPIGSEVQSTAFN